MYVGPFLPLQNQLLSFSCKLRRNLWSSTQWRDPHQNVIDAGTLMNSPYPLLLRPQRAVDIILYFDFSAREKERENLFGVSCVFIVVIAAVTAATFVVVAVAVKRIHMDCICTAIKQYYSIVNYLLRSWKKLKLGHRIPFPVIDEEDAMKDGVKECYVFENKENPNCQSYFTFHWLMKISSSIRHQLGNRSLAQPQKFVTKFPALS